MGRILKPMVRGGGWYPSKKWIPLVKNGGYTTQNGGETEPVWATASGAIASFTTPFAYPLKKLLAQINPVQDLHGYDAPWAGGSGKNLLPMTLANMKTINYAGTWNGNVYTLADVTFTINTDDGGNITSITTNGTSTGTALLRLVNEVTFAEATILNGSPSAGGYNSFKIQAEKVGGGVYQDIGNGISMDANVSLTRIIILAPSGTVLNNTVFYPMVRLSSVTDATFAPYSNVCPITGWTGLSGGVSPCVPEFARDGIQDSTGADAVNPARARTDYLPISLLGKTTNVLSIISAPETDLVFRCAYWYKADKTFISNFASIGSSFPINIPKSVIPADAEYFRFVIQHSDSSKQFPVDVSDYFIAINANPITVSWQSEAGTVYGGTVDVVSGVLTVKKVIETKTWSSAISGGTNLGSVTRRVFALQNACVDNDPTDISNIAIRDGSYTQDSTHFYINGTNTRAYVFLPNDTSGDTEIQLCYSLAIPQTYQLTPQQIETLLGNNTVFVDTGSVEVTYRIE